MDEIAAHRRVSIHERALAALLTAGSADDARPAYHADGAGDREAVLRLAPRAAMRASELDSHRESAAQL